MPALLRHDLDAAEAFIASAQSTATHRAYASDWRIFAAYCEARGLPPLPAAPGTIVAFLSAEAAGGARASTIGRRVAAIRSIHQAAGLEPATGCEAVRRTLRGIRRKIGTAPAQKAPATADLVRGMVEACPATVRGRRDAALLALGFGAALRRSELVALDVADLTPTEDGLTLLIRRSKGYQEGGGQHVALLRGTKIRPVERLTDWLAIAGIAEGAIFRPVRRGGVVSPHRLTAPAVRELVREAAVRAGLDVNAYAAHSLRSGFLTSGANAGASIWKLLEVSRHRSAETLRGYVRATELYRDHAGAAFL